MINFFKLIFIIIILSSCTSTNNLNKRTLPGINFLINEGKYGLILKNTFFRSYKKSVENNYKITIKSELSFSIKDTLSIKGKNNLKKLRGNLDYQIINSINSKVLFSGNINSSISYGSITSLYGTDTSLKFAKERLSKHLANKLYNRVILRVK